MKQPESSFFTSRSCVIACATTLVAPMLAACGGEEYNDAPPNTAAQANAVQSPSGPVADDQEAPPPPTPEPTALPPAPAPGATAP
ncbi:MAG TPA: hypothetical protein VHC69_00595, partial [Polyangiaceae bacterium]|nr:hypothetical protein [Polyangiaceae bacterium]